MDDSAIPMAMTAVCADCGECARAATVRDPTQWHPFRMPVGLNYLRDRPCGRDPALGVDESYLPVTHVGGPNRGPTDSGGVWFYYAEGCSDLLWHMGRTVLARNRAHASVIAEQRDSAASGGALTDREAVTRVAAWMRAREVGRYKTMLRVIRARLRTPNATVEDIVADAARGLYGPCTGEHFTRAGKLRPCHCEGNATRIASKNRARALTLLVGDKFLSLHAEPILRRLPLDTLQLHRQPQGGGNAAWTTEIWDLRGSPALSRHLENATAHPEVVARARWRRSGKELATCTPDAAWHTCFSCAGSELAPHCARTEEWYRRGAGRG